MEGLMEKALAYYYYMSGEVGRMGCWVYRLWSGYSDDGVNRWDPNEKKL